MTRTRFFAAIMVVQAAMVGFAGIGNAQTAAPAALRGRVSSQEEGAMEGVLVSAKREGSTVTITVVSDAQGRYSFPRNRLEAGRYALRIRAVGYELNDPTPVEVTAQKAAELDLKLRKAQDLAAQLSNSEWLISAPGTVEQKESLMGCTGCHTLERVFRSHAKADEFAKLVPRMGRYFEGTTPENPQVLKPGMPGRPTAGMAPAQVEWVTSVNLSTAPQWQYPLKASPRPKGKSTHVIITEYDLPRPHIMPHDVTVDSKGTVWYCDDAHQFIGQLDTKTGKTKEYAIPVLRPGYPTGCRDIYLDRDESVWISLQGQGAVGKFDRKTEKFQVWPLSKQLDPDGNTIVVGVLPQYVHVDGKLWVLSTGKIGKTIERLDTRSGEWEEPIYVFKDIPKESPAANRPHSIYEISSDSKNNGYFTDFSSEFIGKIDAKTRKITFYETPTKNSAPRRGTMDKQDRLWFGEHSGAGNRIGMFDTKTGRIEEWKVPTPFSGPYDVALDKDGYAWTGGEFSDRVARLNTKTGEVVEYMLPRITNIRRVDVDNTTNPASFVVGNTHGVSIVRVEPLE
jgi:streptogramin lyase